MNPIRFRGAVLGTESFSSKHRSGWPLSFIVLTVLLGTGGTGCAVDEHTQSLPASVVIFS